MLTTIDEGFSTTIVNEGLSLTIVNETTNFIKTVVFDKTIVFEKKFTQLYRMSSYMKVKSCGVAKTSRNNYNFSMISTDALQGDFLSPPLFVNDR